MTTKKVFDLNQPIYHNCPCWPTLDPPSVERLYYMPREGANVEMLKFNTHTGTHVDVPYHKLEDGKTLEQIPIEAWIGEGVVIDVSFVGERDIVTAEMLREAAPPVAPRDIAMLYFGWSKQRAFTQKYLMDFPALDETGARWLVDHKVKVVGTDALSIDLFDKYMDPEKGPAAHKVLLGAGVLLVEEVYLEEIAQLGQKRWMFYCLPMAIQGAGGAPARVIAVDQS